MTDEQYEDKMRKMFDAPPAEMQEEAIERYGRKKALAIAIQGVNDAIEYRYHVLADAMHAETLADGDWMSEFAETDPVMGTLHAIRKMLWDTHSEV
jgi:hypothetical protein